MSVLPHPCHQISSSCWLHPQPPGWIKPWINNDPVDKIPIYAQPTTYLRHRPMWFVVIRSSTSSFLHSFRSPSPPPLHSVTISLPLFHVRYTVIAFLPLQQLDFYSWANPLVLSSLTLTLCVPQQLALWVDSDWQLFLLKLNMLCTHSLFRFDSYSVFAVDINAFTCTIVVPAFVNTRVFHRLQFRS